MKGWCKVLGATLMALAGVVSHAQGVLLKVQTRPDIKTTLFWAQAPDAHATVLLFPGGAGGFGKVENGQAMGGNFLVRSVPHFLANGLNVAIFGRPSDMPELGWAERTQPEHLADVRMVIEFLRQKSPAPLWLVGTSRGTVSATASAIALQGSGIAGLVLTSSVVKFDTPGTVVRQNLSAIQVPVLVMHHAKDACIHCRPHEVPAILGGLSAAPVKKLMMLEGGGNPAGGVCDAQHWHGFVGMEKDAVDAMAAWIQNPAN